MANYSNLKAAIAAAIKTNGNQEITGQVLQDVLTSMVSVIGDNYTFTGVATPETNPGTPDQNVVYMASQAGTYSNFNGTVLPAGISLMMWNGAWTSINLLNLDDYQPIIIEGDVTNAPDEEDLTSVNERLRLKNRNIRHGMGCIYLRRELGFAEQLTQENTIYVIRYDYTLTADVTVPANCVLKFDGGSLRNGSLVLQNTLFDGVVKLGGDLEISGTCANQTAYQSWFEDNDIDAFISFINNVSGVFGYEFIAGTFYPTKNINKEVDSFLKVVGNGCTLVYSKDDIDEDCQIHFYKNNTNPTEYNVTHDVTPGTGGFTLNSIEGINKNDYLCIRDIATSSFNYTRNYQQGEFFKVREILSEQSRIVPENYPAGNYMHSADNMNKVYSISFGHIDIDNFNVQIATKEAASFGSSGIELDFLTGSIRNCHIEWFRYNLSLNNCINFIVENCNVISNSNVQTGIDNYGLSINNCQKIDVLGGIFYGGNHGIAVGGTYSNPYSIVDRYINICNAYAYSYRESAGINAHGDTSDINIRGCFTDGMDLSGKNINVIGNTLIDHSSKLISIRESIGGFVNICDNLNVNIIKISYEDNSSITNVFDNCVLSPLMAIISNNGGNSNDGVTIVVDYLCYGNNTYIKQSKAIIDNSVIRVLGLRHLTYNNDAIESYDGEFCVKNSVFNGESGVSSNIRVGDFYLLNNTLNAPFYNYSVKKSFIKGNIFKAPLRRFVDIVPEMICFEGNILYSDGYINLAYIDCAGKIVELYVKNNIVLHDSYYVINVDKTYNYKFKGFVEIPQNAQGFADYNPTTGSIDVSEVYFYTSMFNTIGKNPVMYGIFDNSFTLQRNKIINANYRQFGITSTRPDVSANILNSEYFNTEKNRFNHCVPQPDYSAYVMQMTAYKNNPSFAANLLVENSLYYLRINRDYPRKLYAVKNNEEFDENNSVLLYDAKDQLYTEADTIIKGVNPTTYPYLYAVSNSNSVTAFMIYNCTLKWIDDDGATAGVKRSGVFADKPDAADIYVGFKYFCTDRQTTEGATNGIEIIHKGNNVWVDALGRVVS